MILKQELQRQNEQDEEKIKQNEEQKYGIYIEAVYEARIVGEQKINVSEGNDLKEAVCLLGQTGAGKSTIAASFFGVEYRSHDTANTGKLILEPARNSKQLITQDFIIQAKCQSGTAIPVILKDQDKQIYFVDLPGYNDNKGITQEVVNGFYIYRSFQIHEKVKILFVSSHAALYDGAQIFIQSVENISKSLKNTDYKNCLGMIITSAATPNITSQNIVDDIKKNILKAEERLKQISIEAKQFIEYIADNPNFIAIMHKPLEESDNVSEYYEPFKKNVYSLINNLNSMINPQICTSVSDKAKERLIPFIQEIKDLALKAIKDSIQDIQLFVSEQFVINLVFNDKYNKELNEQQFKKLKTCKDFFTKMETLLSNTIQKTNLQMINLIMDLYSEYSLQIKNVYEIKNNIITMEYSKTIVTNIDVNHYVQEFIKLLKSKMQDCNKQYDAQLKTTLVILNKCAIQQFEHLAKELKQCEYYNNWSDQATKFFLFVNDIQKKKSFEDIHLYFKQKHEEFKLDINCIDQLYELNQLINKYIGKDKLDTILPDLKNKLKDSQLSEIRLLKRELLNDNNNDNETIQKLQQENNQLNQKLIQCENAKQLQDVNKKLLLEKETLFKNLDKQLKILETEQQERINRSKVCSLI